MVKQIKEERTIYCSGPNWEGDSSKVTSACRFGESMKTTVERYKCSRCANGQTPVTESITAGGGDALQLGLITVEPVEPIDSQPVEVETTVESPKKHPSSTRKKKRRRF